MTQSSAVKLFENHEIRTTWDEINEEWLFSVIDVIEVLTGSASPRDYFKKIRRRDPDLDTYVGTNCPHVDMLTISCERDANPRSGQVNGKIE
ncbi:MAG TPA: hypothetical protein O0X70_04520 [Methanocorpusculum sp.]|nr:hypothetical protein [Methanocorpusculum sp.]